MIRVLAELFDGDVATVEVDLYRDPLTDLHPDEARAVASAREPRLLEFRGGRHCARTALAVFGVTGVPILRGEDRSPTWPEGFVGSITHTRARDRGWCGAAVARAAGVRAVGIDAEFDEPLEPKLYERVLTPGERSRLTELPEAERGRYAKLVFSAKESVYKCQYPLSRTFLEFKDVEISVETGGAFRAVLRKDAGPLSSGHVFEGRYTRAGGLVATGLVLR
jgi:4'-phosphopantetheinyl transferase EntD